MPSGRSAAGQGKYRGRGPERSAENSPSSSRRDGDEGEAHRDGYWEGPRSGSLAEQRTMSGRKHTLPDAVV